MSVAKIVKALGRIAKDVENLDFTEAANEEIARLKKENKALRQKNESLIRDVRHLAGERDKAKELTVKAQLTASRTIDALDMYKFTKFYELPDNQSVGFFNRLRMGVEKPMQSRLEEVEVKVSFSLGMLHDTPAEMVANCVTRKVHEHVLRHWQEQSVLVLRKQ